MVGIVVAGHGRIASALVEAVTSIAGSQPALVAVDHPSSEGLEGLRGRIGEAIRLADQGEGVVVLADLLGGTPANCCVPFVESGAAEVVTGVNLPMLLRVAMVRGTIRDRGELVADLVRHGRRNLLDMGGALRSREGGEG